MTGTLFLHAFLFISNESLTRLFMRLLGLIGKQVMREKQKTKIKVWPIIQTKQTTAIRTGKRYYFTQAM